MTDATTTIDDLKAMIQEFCSERDWDQYHNSKDLAIGIVTEGSELLELMRFKTPEQIDVMMSGPRREDVVDELSDTLYFVLRFAQMNGIDLSESLAGKLAKNAEKYPASVVRGCNKKYDEYRGRPEAPPHPRHRTHDIMQSVQYRNSWIPRSSSRAVSSAMVASISSSLHFILCAVAFDIPHLVAADLMLTPST